MTRQSMENVKNSIIVIVSDVGVVLQFSVTVLSWNASILYEQN